MYRRDHMIIFPARTRVASRLKPSDEILEQGRNLDLGMPCLLMLTSDEEG